MTHMPMMKYIGANYRICKTMNSCQLHSEADASKDDQIRPHIRPHIRRPYPTGARYDRIWKFGRISAGAGYDIRCNPNNDKDALIWRQYRASMWLKLYPAKQCSLFKCLQSSPIMTLHPIAKPHISCRRYFLIPSLYYACLILRTFIYV